MVRVSTTMVPARRRLEGDGALEVSARALTGRGGDKHRRPVRIGLMQVLGARRWRPAPNARRSSWRRAVGKKTSKPRAPDSR